MLTFEEIVAYVEEFPSGESEESKRQAWMIRLALAYEGKLRRGSEEAAGRLTGKIL